MKAAVVFAGSAVGACALLAMLRPLLAHPSLSRINYAGRDIPTAAGILFPAVYVPACVIILMVEGGGTQVFGVRESLLLLVVGMCLLGLVDDVAGNRDARGFKGHFKALFNGEVTTGMLKAAGGFVLAIAAVISFSLRWWDVIVNAAIIALAANLGNLMDIAPGRSIKVFLPAFIGVVALNWRAPVDVMPYLLVVGATALALFSGDLAERFMLGDAGSNVLGATIGLAVAVGAGWWWRLEALAFLLLMNALSEKFSFSSIIASNRALNWLDSLGRMYPPDKEGEGVGGK
ncbi:MAG: hypothetical protein CVT63_04155 [Candidatus Anoxymicrobium japonicum]|uniref:UDP-N-acetylmuramyl pentapeptide phosphotransferase/UDP-N-acetylglucosamine-1-phosphate transferase n=1 Tax=Candidatus Anoxymicrobium japonicum TaxID=2013648 RepID=A0A2N3G617_9ACTN|nr:MAG: hypothetical protein CVT63_04155 [Candidatus Anoxymicrobium japonicum]